MLSVVGLIWAFSLAAAQGPKLDLVYEWNLVKYNTPADYPGNATFKPERTMITSTEIGYDRVFFAVPKLWSDNPATLVSIPKNGSDKSPLFEGYPNWDWHKGGVTGEPLTEETCLRFINVFRIRVDRCGRLWVLDSGVQDSYTLPKSICPPKLVGFDLRTHKEVKRIVISKDVLMANSILSNFAVDDTDETGGQPEGNCDVGHIYISDIASPALIVYNVNTTQVWRHWDPAFYPHPDHAVMTVAGETIRLMDGIIGTALSSPGPQRDFFWHAMSSKSVFAVDTAALKTPPAASDPEPLPVRKIGDKSSQSIPLAYDPVEDALVFSPAEESALVSWRLRLKNYRLLAYNEETLQWISEIRPAILDNNNIWVVSSRLQKYEHNTVNASEVNQRVFLLDRALNCVPTVANVSSVANSTTNTNTTTTTTTTKSTTTPTTTTAAPWKSKFHQHHHRLSNKNQQGERDSNKYQQGGREGNKYPQGEREGNKYPNWEREGNKNPQWERESNKKWSSSRPNNCEVEAGPIKDVQLFRESSALLRESVVFPSETFFKQ